MHHSKALLIATAVAAALAAGGASAGSGPDEKGSKSRFPIDLTMVEQRLQSHFQALDANKDELVSLAEFQAQTDGDDMRPFGGPGGKPDRGFREGRHGEWGDEHHGKRAAGEGDRAARQAAHAERRAAFEAELFAFMDTNGDGQLSATEASSENRSASKRQLMRQHAFTRLDADANGSLTKDEFGLRLQHMRGADANGDGVLSRDEAKTLRKHRPDA